MEANEIHYAAELQSDWLRQHSQNSIESDQTFHLSFLLRINVIQEGLAARDYIWCVPIHWI